MSSNETNDTTHTQTLNQSESLAKEASTLVRVIKRKKNKTVNCYKTQLINKEDSVLQKL